MTTHVNLKRERLLKICCQFFHEGKNKAILGIPVGYGKTGLTSILRSALRLAVS